MEEQKENHVLKPRVRDSYGRLYKHPERRKMVYITDMVRGVVWTYTPCLSDPVSGITVSHLTNSGGLGLESSNLQVNEKGHME